MKSVKLFITAIGVLISISSMAGTECVDLNGVYQSQEKRTQLLRFVQAACLSLSVENGTRGDDGKIKFFGKREFQLNGASLCKPAGRCESAKISADGILFTMNHINSVESEKHGLCRTSSYVVSKNPQGSLRAVFQVFQCPDGYSGGLEKLFSPVL